jgi:hypothetical protein
MKKLLLAVPIMLLGASMSYGQGAIVSVPTTTLNLTVGAESAIIVGSTAAFSTSTAFAAYTTSTPFTYYIRTSGSGTGAISVKFVSDWAGPGGPAIVGAPTAGDYLSYINTVSNPGTVGAAGNVTALGTAYSVATFSSGAASAIGGNTGSVAWSLVNDPNYKQGSYSITATFTISAT